MEKLKYIELNQFPYYYACNDGKIYSKRGRGKKKDSYNNTLIQLKEGRSSSGSGYFQVSLPCNESKSGYRSKLVHILIAEAFYGKVPIDKTVSHKDGNKYNNNPNNLVLESLSENHKRKLEHGTDDRGYKNR